MAHSPNVSGVTSDKESADFFAVDRACSGGHRGNTARARRPKPAGRETGKAATTGNDRQRRLPETTKACPPELAFRSALRARQPQSKEPIQIKLPQERRAAWSKTSLVHQLPLFILASGPQSRAMLALTPHHSTTREARHEISPPVRHHHPACRPFIAGVRVHRRGWCGRVDGGAHHSGKPAGHLHHPIARPELPDTGRPRPATVAGGGTLAAVRGSGGQENHRTAGEGVRNQPEAVGRALEQVQEPARRRRGQAAHPAVRRGPRHVDAPVARGGERRPVRRPGRAPEGRRRFAGRRGREVRGHARGHQPADRNHREGGQGRQRRGRRQLHRHHVPAGRSHRAGAAGAGRVRRRHHPVGHRAAEAHRGLFRGRLSRGAGGMPGRGCPRRGGRAGRLSVPHGGRAEGKDRRGRRPVRRGPRRIGAGAAGHGRGGNGAAARGIGQARGHVAGGGHPDRRFRRAGVRLRGIGRPDRAGQPWRGAPDAAGVRNRHGHGRNERHGAGGGAQRR